MEPVINNLFSAWNIDLNETIGLIFDIDELLVDNRGQIKLAYEWLLDSRGIKIDPDENFPGSNLFDIVSRIKGKYKIEESVETLIEERRGKYVELLKNTDTNLKEGVKDIFNFLETKRNKLKVKIAYTSSSEKAFIDIILRKIFEFCNLPQYIINPDNFFYHNQDNELASTCWEKGLAKKPDPMLYAKTIEKIGLELKQCIAFEDSTSGLSAALAAGLKVILVPSCNYKKSFAHLKPNIFYGNICKKDSLADFLETLHALAEISEKISLSMEGER